MTAPVTEKHRELANTALGYEPSRPIPLNGCTLHRVATAIADAEARGREQGINQVVARLYRDADEYQFAMDRTKVVDIDTAVTHHAHACCRDTLRGHASQALALLALSRLPPEEVKP